jgi:hypothetical protein
VVVAEPRHLHRAGRGEGRSGPERLVLAPELLERLERFPQGAVEVAEERGAPGHGQCRHGAEIRVVDRLEQRRELLASASAAASSPTSSAITAAVQNSST